MECNVGNTRTSMPQSWDWLEDKRIQDDKVSREIWKAIKAKAGKIRVAEVEEKREEARKRKEARGKGVKEGREKKRKTKKRREQ